MKIFSLALLAVIFLNINSVKAFSGGRDSLTFDGAEEFIPIKNISAPCELRVTYVSGKVEGTKFTKQAFVMCGIVQNDSIEVEEVGQIKVGDRIKPNKGIKTGPDGEIEITTPHGSIRIAPNTSFNMSDELCGTYVLGIDVGEIYSNVTKLFGNESYTVVTERDAIGVRGTKFLVKSSHEKDEIKLYEGSIELNLKVSDEAFSTSQDKQAEMLKLQQEYANGKITLEEYTKKMGTIFSSKKKEDVKLMLEAGYMVTVTDKISTPVLLPENENNWFDDANFFK